MLNKVFSNACKTLLTGAVLALIAIYGGSPANQKKHADALANKLDERLRVNNEVTIGTAQYNDIRSKQLLAKTLINTGWVVCIYSATCPMLLKMMSWQ